MKKNSLISVVIPAYNREKYLPECLNSVLAQTLPADEIIVVDDGSTDGTAEVARSFGGKIRVHSRPNGGIGAARNDGVRLATGEILTFLDSDDLWEPDKLRRQREELDRDSVDYLFTWISPFLSPDLSDEEKNRKECPSSPLPGPCPSTWMIRRRAFLDVGFFDEVCKMGEFMDWHLRATEKGLQYRVIPESLARRRVHSQNQGTIERPSQRDYLKILKASLDRRRKAEGALP
ncbi:MAG: glycosyltransferase family A protein [bacterium]